MQLSFDHRQPERTKPQAFKLRPYQVEAINAANRKFADGAKSLLIVLPTGAGKTVAFAQMCKQRLDRGRRTMMLVHRDELIRQAARKIEDVCGVRPGIEKAAERSSADDPIVIGSVQTLIRRKELPGEPFNFVIVDEAHHCSDANSYAQVLANLNPHQLLGVTATPWRSDKIALSNVFEDTAYSLSLMDLINQGYLADIKVRSLPVKIDLSSVHTQKGDFVEGELGAVLEPHLEALAAIVAKQYPDRKMVSFCPLCETSRLWTQKLLEKGLPAAHIDGDSPDRADILKAYTKNEIRFLSNASLLTEGWDEPSVDTIFLLRPTKSRVLMSQMIGRGTRLYPGKEELLVLDPCFVSERHNIISVADLDAEDDKHASGVKKRMDAGKSLQEATEDERAARRDALAEAIRANAHRESYEKKIAEVSLAFGIEGLEDWQPVYRWQKQDPTKKQLETLEKIGIDPAIVSCKGMAAVLLGNMTKRRDEGLATLKQVRFLMRKGVQDADKLTFADASKMMDRISSGWTRKTVAPRDGVAACD